MKGRTVGDTTSGVMKDACEAPPTICERKQELRRHAARTPIH